MERKELLVILFLVLLVTMGVEGKGGKGKIKGKRFLENFEKALKEMKRDINEAKADYRRSNDAKLMEI
uniref:Uncharacterized protein n=1 Tax=Isometrus maculatus TaxID=497827 RepID=A0A0U1TYI6_ISOMC|nr:hypothetical protein [Isometrus maculatus]